MSNVYATYRFENKLMPRITLLFPTDNELNTSDRIIITVVQFNSIPRRKLMHGTVLLEEPVSSSAADINPNIYNGDKIHHLKPALDPALFFFLVGGSTEISVHAMKVHTGCRITAPVILNTDSRWR
jgi:hypothetical protein